MEKRIRQVRMVNGVPVTTYLQGGPAKESKKPVNKAAERPTTKAKEPSRGLR